MPGGGGAVPPTDRAPEDPRPVTSDRALRLIALFKFGKAALLVLIAAGALGLVRRRWPHTPSKQSPRWLPAATIACCQRSYPSPRPPPHRLEAFGAGAFLYAGLFLVEGVGLWRGRRWGEYLTVIATASLVPLELWELSRRLTTVRVLALVLNLLIVAYLIGRLRRRRPRIRATAA